MNLPSFLQSFSRMRARWAIAGMMLPMGAAFPAETVATMPDSRDGTRPNILFIMVDDLKPVLGCYGDGLSKTPNLDRLAARGLRFDRAYCNQAVCAPSRNSLMTGSRPTTVGIYDLATNFRVATPDAVTLPQYFQRHGWRTESLGKIMHPWHGNFEDAASWSVPHWVPEAPKYADPANRALHRKRIEAERAKSGGVARGEPGSAGYLPAVPQGLPVECADVPDDAYDDGLVAGEAVRRLRAAQARPDEPWFLAVGFYRPHLPFAAPKKYWDLYHRDQFPLARRRTPPDDAPEYAGAEWGELRAYIGMPQSGPLTADQQRELIHGYYAATSYADAQIGRVLDELERLGLASNTIVVVWGDHGFHLGDHGLWCKHTNYEEAVRQPLVIATPRTGAGATTALVESVDIYPTLAELAGLPPPAGPQPLDGRSFAAVFGDIRAATKEAVFHAYPRSRGSEGQIIGRALRTAQHRLIEWKKPGAASSTAEYELYDYAADPDETRNLAASEPELLGRLRTLLAAQPEARAQIQRPAAPSKSPPAQTP